MRKNIILITIDCLRNDAFNNPKYAPFLNGLRDKSLYFSHCYSNGSWTPTSFISIMTSTYPSYSKDHFFPGKSRKLLSEILSKNDYLCAAFHSNTWLSKYFGYNRGFEFFCDYMKDQQLNEKDANKLFKRIVNLIITIPIISSALIFILSYLIRPVKPYVNADVISSDAIKWLKSPEYRRKNIFLWLHFMDIHGPFYPAIIPENYNIRYTNKLHLKLKYSPQKLIKEEIDDIKDIYLNNLKYLDDAINRFYSKLSELGLLEESTIIIASDHGEQFKEHGNFHHGGYLYNELLNVPLIVHNSQITSATVNEVVSNIDISPTILFLTGIEKPLEYVGNSLLTYEIDKNEYVFFPRKHPYAISEEMCVSDQSGLNHLLEKIEVKEKKVSYILEDVKYIYNSNGNDELYFFSEDRGEKNNKNESCPEVSSIFKERICKHLLKSKKIQKRRNLNIRSLKK